MKVYWHTGEKSLSVKPNHFWYTHHQPVASPALVYFLLPAKDSSASRISVIEDEELNDVCVVASCLWSINRWHQDYFGCGTDAHVQRRMLHLHWLVAGGDNWVSSWGTHVPADACSSVPSFIGRKVPIACVSAYWYLKAVPAIWAQLVYFWLKRRSILCCAWSHCWQRWRGQTV